jgi:hypothetical protein
MRTDERLRSALSRTDLPWPGEAGAWDRFLRRRRRLAVRGVVAACLVVAVGVVGIRALPLGGEDFELGGPVIAGPPRSYVVSVHDGKTSTPAPLGQQVRQRLIRVDAASGRPMEILTDRLRETVTWWQLLDDGSVVADVIPSDAKNYPQCGHHLKHRRPDGRWVDLGTVPVAFGGKFAISPDGRLLAAMGPLCQDGRPVQEGWGGITIYRIGAKIAARPLAEVSPASGKFPSPPVSVSFSSDSRRVAVTRTGEVDVVDLAGGRATLRTVVRPQYDTCSYSYGQFGTDPDRLLVGQIDCQKPPFPKTILRQVSELDLTTGRWRQLTRFGDHVWGIDYDASRTRLLVGASVPRSPTTARPGTRLPTTDILYAWDGTTLRQLRLPSFSQLDISQVEW